MARYKYKSAVHLNGNLMAAVDIATTGSDPRVNEIIQVVIIPLNSDYEMHQDVPFFDVRIKPSRPDMRDGKTRVSKASFIRAVETGLDPFLAADLFEDWFVKLELGEGKKIVPLGHNYDGFDRQFLIEWLGEVNYQDRFSHLSRDPMKAAIFVADAEYERGVPPSQHYFGLGSLAYKLGVEGHRAHDSISDAITAARCYRKLTGVLV